MKASRLGEAEIGVAKPDLHHEPCDAAQGPFIGCCVRGLDGSVVI
jgi:hypothetical protein